MYYIFNLRLQKSMCFCRCVSHMCFEAQDTHSLRGLYSLVIHRQPCELMGLTVSVHTYSNFLVVGKCSFFFFSFSICVH